MRRVAVAAALIWTLAVVLVVGCGITHAADCKKALTATFGNEGGFTIDQGGPTKYGISQHSYPKEDIRNLTLDRAAYLYKRDFWAVMQGDRIASDIIAGEIFDGGVNMGINTEIRLVQESCNLAYFPAKPLKVTGCMDKATLARVNGDRQDMVYVNLIGLRYGRYHFLAVNNPKKYGISFRSWTMRIKNNVRGGVHAYDRYLGGKK